MASNQTHRTDTTSTRRRFIKASGASAVALSLAGCSGLTGDSGGDQTETKTETESTDSKPGTVQKDGKVPRGGTFTYGMAAKPDTTNVLTASSVYSAVANGRVYMSGVMTDPVTYKPKPWVYTDWTVKNYKSKNAKPDVYFNVRDGLTWNDGKKFTNDDVQFTYDYLLKNKPGNYAGAIRPIETVEPADKGDWDFHMKLKQKLGTWEIDSLGGIPLLAKHQWKGVDYQKFDPMKDGGPVGLGPGEITKFEPDTAMRVEFTNMDSYKTLSNLQWRKDHQQILAGGPFIDAINYKIFGNESAMTQAFLRGSIDAHYGTFKTSQMKKAKQKEGRKLIPAFDSGFSFFGFNLRRKPLDDATLRQAMAMAWDEYNWVNNLNKGNIIDGDYPHSPGYKAARPETNFGGKLLESPASEAFLFRNLDDSPAQVDVKGIRGFLKSGKVVSGSGTYAGEKYSGTLSGVKASQSKAKYTYTFGPVKSNVLKQAKGVDKELYVNEKTIPQMMDGEPITQFIDPPKQSPNEAKAIKDWVANLKKIGIPVKTKVLSFNAMSNRVFYDENYDIHNMGWAGTGAFGSSLWSFFHSDNADVKGNKDSFTYNSTGYGDGKNGYDKQLTAARKTMDLEQMAKKFAKANERIYLDMPYYVMDYADVKWPVKSAKWKGFVSNIVDPGYETFGLQMNNVHKKK